MTTEKANAMSASDWLSSSFMAHPYEDKQPYGQNGENQAVG
jgi:hypothetical protein